MSEDDEGGEGQGASQDPQHEQEQQAVGVNLLEQAAAAAAAAPGLPMLLADGAKAVLAAAAAAAATGMPGMEAQPGPGGQQQWPSSAPSSNTAQTGGSNHGAYALRPKRGTPADVLLADAAQEVQSPQPAPRAAGRQRGGRHRAQVKAEVKPEEGGSPAAATG